MGIPPRDESDDLAEQQRLWRVRLRECIADEEEITRCVTWLEMHLLDHILISWFLAGRVAMRWNALEGRPDFEPR
jgi:hypothetical protein